MKKRNLVVYIMIALFIASSSLYAGYKSEAKIDISDAEKAYKKLMKSKKLIAYIPHEEYNDGLAHFKLAEKYKDDSDWEETSYYAVLAMTDFVTCKYLAEIKYAKNAILLTKIKTLKADIKYYRNAAKKEMLKAAIASAKLEKKGKALIGVLDDKLLFARRSFNLTDKAKSKILDKIYDVLSLYPKSKIVIKGHTRRRDRNNNKSSMKAEAVQEYFTTEKGLPSSRVKVKAMGNSQKVKVRNRMKTVDRVEIILTGVR